MNSLNGKKEDAEDAETEVEWLERICHKKWYKIHIIDAKPCYDFICVDCTQDSTQYVMLKWYNAHGDRA